ncbi:MAG TPA: hypothetical protein VGO45_03070 [Bacteroidia bacterium]|jgi:hypothetical protein|nr:hypothetical protein [Bacteroidia bacterium]
MLRLTRIFLLFCSCLLLTGYASFAGNGDNDKKQNKEEKSTKISDIQLDSANRIHWTVLHQQGLMSFSVEQFLNEHWVMVGEVVGDSHLETNEYSYSPHFTSGENRYRIAWSEDARAKNYSNIVTSVSKKAEVLFHVTDDNLQVAFSENTLYMVYNPYGFIISRGYGSNIDIAEYKPGMYCVTYDNKVASFEKKVVWFSHSKHPIVRDNKPEPFKRAKKPYEMTPP